jgi:methionine biosynthesis protein MetW
MTNTSLATPDSSAIHFLGYEPNPLRYDYYDSSEYEAHNIIASLIPLGSRVLEIGCGTGILGEVLRHRGDYHYEGIEPSKARAKMAKSKGLSIHNMYLDETTIHEFDTFDVIVLADVIEHLEAPHRLLGLVSEIMHSKSFVIVSVPNIAHWSIRINLLAGHFQYTETGILDSTHLRWFTVQTLIEYLRSTGFCPAKTRYTSGYMLPCYSFLRSGLLKVIPKRHQERALAVLVKRWPALYACQVIVSCNRTQQS